MGSDGCPWIVNVERRRETMLIVKIILGDIAAARGPIAPSGVVDAFLDYRTDRRIVQDFPPRLLGGANETLS